MSACTGQGILAARIAQKREPVTGRDTAIIKLTSWSLAIITFADE